MGLFNKLDKPVFLKEESDAVQFICRLKGLHGKAYFIKFTIYNLLGLTLFSLINLFIL